MRDGVHRGTALAKGPRSRAGHGRSPVHMGELAPFGLCAAVGEDAHMKSTARTGHFGSFQAALENLAANRKIAIL